MHRRSLVLLAALVLGACHQADRVTGAPQLSAAATASLKTSLSGEGLYDLTAAGAGIAAFTYAVQQVPGEAATGTFHLRFEADGFVVDFDGEASCLSVDGANGRGWVGGTITANRSTHPSFLNPLIHVPGADVWFRAVDYGEGSNAADDRSTTFGFRGSAGIITSAEYCATRPWPAADARTWPVIAGNIQVKP